MTRQATKRKPQRGPVTRAGDICGQISNDLEYFRPHWSMEEEFMYLSAILGVVEGLRERTIVEIEKE